MFSESSIAKKCQMSNTKMSYFVNFGSADYFVRKVLELVKKSAFYSLSFDESLTP